MLVLRRTLGFALLISLASACAIASTGNASSPNPAAPIASPQPTPLRSGTFRPAEHPTQGKVTILREGDRRYLVLGDDFNTDAGPDLFVVLHRSDKLSATSKFAEGDYLSLAPLRQTSGGQRYAIPDAANLEDYAAVAIWCRQFNATFGFAPLS